LEYARYSVWLCEPEVRVIISVEYLSVSQ
jgi:hypothetical protein